jgi:hypothetical protein
MKSRTIDWVVVVIMVLFLIAVAATITFCAPTITIAKEPLPSVGHGTLMPIYYIIDGMPEEARRTAWLMYVEYGPGIITWGCAESRTEEWGASCCCESCLGLDVRGRAEGGGVQYLGFVATRDPSTDSVCPGVCGLSCSGGGNGATIMRQTIRPDYDYWIAQPDGVYEREVRIQDGHSCCWDENCGDTTALDFEPRRALGLTPGPALVVHVRKEGETVVFVEDPAPLRSVGPVPRFGR